MKIVIQIVSSASLQIQNAPIADIQKGAVIFVGFSGSDRPEIIDRMIHKLLQLRIFPDANGKTNLTIHDFHGEILCVPNFTLYADVTSSRRPSFTNAANAKEAILLFNYTKQLLLASYPQVQFGEFGADMSVLVHNQGPFTLILDSDE